MPQVPKFEDQGGAVVLCCPHCQNKENTGYLHHTQIDAYERDEDAKTGLHVSVTGKNLRVDSNSPLSGNPSSRREGIVITFWCDNCHETSKLTIAQHKGQTLIEHIKEPAAQKKMV